MVQLVSLHGVQLILQVKKNDVDPPFFLSVTLFLIIDVVKTRIQSEPERYKGFSDCIKHSYREEGWRIFFKGLTPTILRAFPSNAATFAAYTWAMKVCQPKPLTTRQHEEQALL